MPPEPLTHDIDDPPTFPLSWREELRVFLELMGRMRPSLEQAREQQSQFLRQTLDEEVYPAFEEFLGEITRYGTGGQIYGRGSGYAITLRLDDGFEVAVERDRYREQAHLVPRLIFIAYSEEGGRKFLTTQGVSWSRIKKHQVIARVLEEYKRWCVQRLSLSD